MAQNIQDLIVKLKAEGFEHIEKLKGSFRELNKVTNATESQIQLARKELLDLAKASGNSEVANRGLIEAFKGLRSQVDLNGKTYQSLTTEITRMDSVLRGSTPAIDKQRAALLEHSRAGNQNAKSLQQQIDGLERLQKQTRPGSEAFLRLGKDIDQATKNLGRFKSEASAAASTLTQIPAASLEKISVQIGRLQGQMQKLNITSDEFLNYQQRIDLIGTVRSRTQGRQQVRALNAMYESEQFTKYAEGRAANLELPNTLAGIQLRISEINSELQNITGYTRRRELTIELKDLNRQLKNSIVDVVTQEDLALQRLRARVNAQREINQASGFKAFSQQVSAGEYDPAITKSIKRARQRLEQENERLRKAANEAFNTGNAPLLLPAAGGTAGEVTLGKTYGGGARLLAGQTEVTFGPSGLGRTQLPTSGNIPTRGRRAFIEEREALRGADFPSAAVGVAPAVAGKLAEQFDNLGRSVERNRRPLRDIYVDIDKTTKASNGSINSLDAQIAVWTELRNAVGGTAPAFDTATKKLNQLTTQRERLGTDRSRRLSGSQLAQGFGAAISGGIFGGPEGLIGGLGGLALGGVGGAFAGAAAGAQVGMFRQQLGDLTEYSSRIDKLQISLRGIVGSQDAYNTVLASAARMTKDLNIPQETAIQGLTRLSAAVLGAGGNVNDSTFAFGAIAKAIKATGGSAEEADGALLALTQVFSKGKVSAEELNQIAERLPGTFTVFAKATGRTGPELLKALQNGQVGLNDLMKFLGTIDTQYGQTALRVSASTQDAGARLTVATQAMQRDVGRALQPIGAQLQDAFAKFITDITPAVTAAAKAITAAFKFFAENKTVSGLATFTLQLGATALGISTMRIALEALAKTDITSTLSSTRSAVKVTGDVMETTAGKTKLFSAAASSLLSVLSKLAALQAITVSVTYIQKRIEAGATIQELSERESAGGAATQFKGATRETVLAAQEAQRKEQYRQKQRALKRQKELQNNAWMYQIPVLNTILAQQFAEQQTTAEYQQRFTQGVLSLDPSKFPKEKPLVPSLFPDLAGETAKDKDKKAKDKAAKAAQAAAAEQQRIANTLLDQQLNAADKLFQHQTELDRQRYELQKRLDDLQAQNRALRETGAARDIVNNFQELQQNLRGIEDRRLEAKRAVALAEQAKSTDAIRASFADQGAAALGAGGMLKGLPSGIAGYITGDPRSAYYRADHGGANYHEHLSFVSRQAAEAAYKRLIASGIKVTEFKGYGRVGGHSEGSAHYSGLAFDVPGAQVGIGKQRELTARVQSVLGFGSKRLPTGAATQQIRAIQIGGKATVEQLNVAAAKQAQKNLEDQVAQERAAIFEQFTLKSTAALREQNKTMRDSAELQQLRNRLTLEGVTPNLIDLEENLLRVRQQQNEAEATYSKLIATTKNPAELSALTRTLAEQNAGFAEQIRLLREGTAAKESFDNAIGLREGAQQYVQSIGTMREATAQLAQTGIKGVEDALLSLATTGTANFKEFAANILRDTTRIIIQQLILRTVMQAIGAIGGGGGSSIAKTFEMPNAAFIPSGGFKFNALGAAYAANGIVPFAMGGAFQRGVTPYAMGGIVSRPTFFAYANGGVPGTGLMGEAGPEAVVPLRRLPNGKLGVGSTGGGSTNVTVNVDATGSSVQGDSTQGAALGRAIAAAVQTELVNQKRRGGLLNS